MAKKRKKEFIKKETEEIKEKKEVVDRQKAEPLAISSRLGQNKEKQEKSQKKILRNILIMIGIVMAGFFLFVIISNYSGKFGYRGVDFEIVKFCDAGPPCLVTYRTSLPVRVDGEKVVISNPREKTNDYNFYLRNDPRKLDVNFTGNLIWRNNMVFNSEADFVCDGKGAIAGANFIKLYGILGTKVIKDENASCDSLGRYMFVLVKPGNETRVEQFGPGCYNIYIKDCEVLEGIERFMIETFVSVNEVLKEQNN